MDERDFFKTVFSAQFTGFNPVNPVNPVSVTFFRHFPCWTWAYAFAYGTRKSAMGEGKRGLVLQMGPGSEQK